MRELPDLLTDSERRYHAPLPDRPEHQVVLADGRARSPAVEDPLTQLLEADARRELEDRGVDLGFLR